MHINKVSHVTTINRVARDLGENEDRLFEIAADMDPEDGIIWVHGIDENGIMAFTDFGIDTLIDLIKIQRRSNHPERSGYQRRCGLGRMVTPSPADVLRS